MSKKILVVDDEENFIKAYERLFRETEYEIISAVSGVGAMTQIHKNKPDLVILDMKMPGGGGDDVYDILKLSNMTDDLPIIFVSGMDIASARADFSFITEDNFFPKPFDPQELIAKIDSLLKD